VTFYRFPYTSPIGVYGHAHDQENRELRALATGIIASWPTKRIRIKRMLRVTQHIPTIAALLGVSKSYVRRVAKEP